MLERKPGSLKNDAVGRRNCVIVLRGGNLNNNELRILQYLAGQGQGQVFTSKAPLGSTSNERAMLHTGIRPAEYNQAVQHLLDRGFIELANPRDDAASPKSWIRLKAQGRDELEERSRRMSGQPKSMTDYEQQMIEHVIKNKWKRITDFNSFPQSISRDKMDAVFQKWEQMGYAKIHWNSSSGRREIDLVDIIKSLEFYRDEMSVGGSPAASAPQVNVHVAGDLKTGGHFVAGFGQASGDVSNTEISSEQELVAAIRDLISELRQSAEASSKGAADELARACGSTSKVEVATALEQAIKHKPDLMERLRYLATGTASSLAGSALFAGLKFVIGV